ncbi:MAG TPA: hypothetical protein VEL74_14955 [Thermoanaerobaculia bacterium]|nr:hypothetical protein [Thermoanaerobaculia bacterium]
MAEPARKALNPEDAASAELIDDEAIPGIDIVQRWVEGPDGRMELLELPLTPELFLDPQDEDKIIQHPDHHKAVHALFDRLDLHFESDPDVMVLSDAKHLLGPGAPAG